ncbi:MAG: AI-2E family transporter, partial [Planctomycetota bacterium]
DKFARIRTSLPAGWQEFIREWEESDVEGRRLILYGLVKNLFTRDGAVRRSLQAVALGAFAAILWVFQFILFFVVMVYLLLDIDRLRGWMRSALPRRYKDEILRISGKVDTNVKAFFRGQVVVVLVLSAIFSLGLLIIGCPFWYVVGVAGGLGAFIPYFALASGMVPAIVLTAIEYANPLLGAAAAAVVFAVGMTIDNVLVTPRIIGRSVGMHPVAVILSILIFGTLFGFLGVLFAVPIAAVVKVLAQELFARYRSSALYAAEPTGTIEPEEGA